MKIQRFVEGDLHGGRNHDTAAAAPLKIIGLGRHFSRRAVHRRIHGAVLQAKRCIGPQNRAARNDKCCDSHAGTDLTVRAGRSHARRRMRTAAPCFPNLFAQLANRNFARDSHPGRERFGASGTRDPQSSHPSERTGPIAAFLANKPANLTSPVVQAKSDGSIFLTISNGVEGKMPPLNENLTVSERWDLVNFIRTLKPPKK